MATGNVWVEGKWYGPSYPDAGDPPGSSDRVKDESKNATEALSSGDNDPPPLAGPGSGRARWAVYAVSHAVTIDDEMSRDEIVAACRERGVPVE